MTRLRSLLLLGGTVLVMSYISAPAAPTPAPGRAPDDQVRAIDAMAPIAGDATQEASKLRERLAIVPERSEPRRDPFAFGAAPRAKRVTTTPEAETIVPEAVVPPPIVWPKLVALLTEKGNFTAVLGVEDSVEMLKVGESAGGFVVREITATSVELLHVATSATTRLTLR